MKTKIILSALMLFCSTLPTLGQSSKGQTHTKEPKTDMKPEYQAKQESEKAQTKLGLNADQTAKWEQAALTRINANFPYREKMSKATTPEERKELKSKMKVNRDQFDNNVKGFLNPDQISKWESFKSQKRKGMHKGMKGHGQQ